MARPKKDESLRKGRQISVRFSEAEYAKITELTKRQNTTVADYLRDRSVHGKVETTLQIIADPEEVKKAARELNGILVNLQQISKYYNTSGTAVLKKMAGERIGNFKTSVQ